MRMGALRRLGLLGMLLWGARSLAAGEDVRRVVDLGFETPGVAELRARWGWGFGRYPAFIGDVNGDGYEEVLVRNWSKCNDGPTASLLLWGGPHWREAGRRELASMPATRLVEEDILGAFRALGDQSYTGLGDLDGDGYGDFAVASYGASWDGVENAGQILIFFGAADFPAEIPLWAPEATGIRFLRITSRVENLAMGLAISRAGDLNGDGLEDLVFSAKARGTEDGKFNAGKLYILLDGFRAPGEVDISELGGRLRGVVVRGAYGDRRDLLTEGDNLGSPSWRTLCPAGDVNGDGYGDLLAGADDAGHLGPQKTGSAYIVFGGPELEGEIRVSDSERVVEIQGTRPLGQLGNMVAGAGDVNGDGLDDILLQVVENYWTGPRYGTAYLVYGRREWPRVATVGEVAGFQLDTDYGLVLDRLVINASTNVGWGVYGVGDQNGDGLSDILITARRYSNDVGALVGGAYLIWGSSDLRGVVLESKVGTEELPGVVFEGGEIRLSLGAGGGAGGDLDGDGRADFILVGQEVSGVANSVERQCERGNPVKVFFGGEKWWEGLAVNEVVPGQGLLEGGERVRIRGRGFGLGTRVWFGGRECPEVEVLHTARLEVVVPPGDKGGVVDVEVEVGGRRAVLEGGYRYESVPRLYPDLVLEEGDLRAKGYRFSRVEGLGALMQSFDWDGDGLRDLVIVEHGRREDGFYAVHARFSGPGWPEVIAAEEFSEAGTQLLREGGIGWNLDGGVDLTGDGLYDVAMGGPLEGPRGAFHGWTYVFSGWGPGQWPYATLVDEALEGGDAYVHEHWGQCGHSRVAMLRKPEEAGVLAVSYNLCGFRDARVNLFAGPLEGDERGRLEPASVILGPGLPDRVSSDPYFPREFGYGLDRAGDVNGDGWDDLLVGQLGARGLVYVLLGGEALYGRSWTIEEVEEAGLAVRVELALDVAEYGRTVFGDFDFNGDGYSDVVLSARFGGYQYDGWSFIVLGGEDLGAGVRRIDLLKDRERVVHLVSPTPFSTAGVAYPIGDFNGDGLDDVAVGGWVTSEELRAQGKEVVSVVFGRREPPERIELGERLLGVWGFTIRPGGRFRTMFDGEFNRRVVGGDFDGDGNWDLAVSVGNGGDLPPLPEDYREDVWVIFGQGGAPGLFVRGEVNGDGRVDLSDAVAVLMYLFAGGELDCEDAADADDSGSLDISDGVWILRYLFQGGAPPPAPFAEPGLDPTRDALGCRGVKN